MRKTLIVILNEREGSIAVMRNSVAANVSIKSFQQKNPLKFPSGDFIICQYLSPYSSLFRSIMDMMRLAVSSMALFDTSRTVQ